MLVQATILGFLSGELWYLTQAVATTLNAYIQVSSWQGFALVICGLTSPVGIAYFCIRGGLSDLGRLWRSNRVDLFAIATMIALGLSISVSAGGFGTLKYQKYVDNANNLLLILLIAVPVLVALMLELKVLSKFMRSSIRSGRPKPSPFFLNDQDIKSAEHDLLGSKPNASLFAERVLNRGSIDSLVFGIDAPWGIGKSSFVNFCCEYWKTETHSRPIIHRFEPLRYKESADLVDEFVNELANKIQQHAFAPSIRTLFSRYLRLIKGENELSFFGIKWDLATSAGTAQETLDNLEALLLELDRKIIIVVDDLDRLSWTEVKNILFAIKRSFMLPNVSYVLCYDTENLSLQQDALDDAEKVREFLEKFVNVKISLFLDSTSLAKYVSTNFALAVKSNRQIDRFTHDKIQEAIDGLVTIYNSSDFFLYQELLGDIRKLKRLINTLVLLQIDQTDFANSDFNKIDIVHLLLVYINYPHIFRKIYNAETNGKAGFFSLNRKYTDTGNKFENSSHYETYLKTLPKNQQFLLNKIFHVGTLAHGASVESVNAQTVDDFEMRSRACFNGLGTKRNLERYLYLIVKQSKQDKLESYQFYLKQKDRLIQGQPLEAILQNDDFHFSKGDFSRDQLWRIILNSMGEIRPVLAGQVVVYLIDHLPEYSLLEEENIGTGSRSRLIYSLLKLLDEAAWGNGLASRRNNSAENIAEIADWVFGENSHAGTGVLSTLSNVDRGPLGLFDLLLFRLYCSPDRENSLFNLQRAIALHGNAAAPTNGIVAELAKEGMREISQTVFQIFRKQYIESKRNLFEAVDNLTQNDFAGESAQFLRRQIEGGIVRQERVDELIAVEKSRVKVFVIYQLGNSMISSGVGCGFYDETGSLDQKGIAARVNDYLFDECFNPAKGSNNVEHFLDYLLMNLAHSFDVIDGLSHVPTVAEFTKVLDGEQLKVYWQLHRSEILEAKFPEKEKSVSTGNYVVPYAKGLPAVYRVLDELLGASAGATN
jgi:hypothetical protein